ncbi:MAG: sigma-70 family RNA polymerase sigma factor [Pseudomonadota bacterium]
MNPSTASDLQLVAWIKAGDKNLFVHLVERHQVKCMSLAYSVTKNRDLAEDVLQDAFLSAYNNLSHYQPTGSFSAWLSRIVLNKSLNATKKRKREFFALTDEVPDTSTESPIEVHQRAEMKRDVLGLLDTLPPSEALMLRLFYLMDMSIEQIHGVTDLSKANIKTLLHRARKRFGRLWDAREENAS